MVSAEDMCDIRRLAWWVQQKAFTFKCGAKNQPVCVCNQGAYANFRWNFNGLDTVTNPYPASVIQLPMINKNVDPHESMDYKNFENDGSIKF